MEVDGIRAFAVENGVLVHNSTRYLVMTGIDLAITEAQARVSFFKTRDRQRQMGGSAADQSMGY